MFGNKSPDAAKMSKAESLRVLEPITQRPIKADVGRPDFE
jgi:hypothetical protein